MQRKLIDHIRRYVESLRDDEEEVLGFFQFRTFRKKENLINQGTRCRFHYFVLQGCLRMFFIDGKGVEQTVQFAIEDWWITDYAAFEQQAQTEFTVQAMEESAVMQIDRQRQEKLFSRFPQLERYFRLIYQRAYAASQLRTKYLYDFSREQFYYHFRDHFPEFTRRIPQQILASYLNMTPEYLSEIKKRSRS
ncbi:MAG: Crp/Fnr family transcriptional regulator [Solitalea sp.]